MKRLNTRLLIWLIVTPLVLAIGVHFLHAFQIDRNADSLKQQAEEAVRKEDYEEAISRYRQFLKHRPNDSGAYAELSRLVADVADKPHATLPQIRRAYQVMEDAVRRHGDLDEVRLRLIDYCMRFGLFRHAIDHIDLLRGEGRGKDPSLDVKYAQCLLATARQEKAVKRLTEVLGYDQAKHEFTAANPPAAKVVDAYVLLAEIYRRQADDSQDADIVINQLVEVNPDLPKAYAERGRYFMRKRKLAEADEDLKKALSLEADNADFIVTSAEIASALEDPQRAETLLQEGLKNHPDDDRFYRALASLELRQKNVEKAMQYVMTGLEHAPNNQALLVMQADLQLQTSDLDGVRTTVAELEKNEVRPELVQYLQCCILMAERKWLLATRALEKLRPQMARDPELTLKIDLMLGQGYAAAGQPDRGIDAYQRALDTDPQLAPALLGKAECLRALGRSAEATQILANVQQNLESAGGTVRGSAIEQSQLQTAINTELAKPENQRDWKEVNARLAELLSGDSLDEVRKEVLKAEVLMMQNDFRRAQSVLAAAVKEHPKELAVWLGLFKLVSQDKDSKYTPEVVLDRAEKAIGPVLPLKQIRLALATQLPAKEAMKKVKAIEADMGVLSDEQRIAFLADLGNAYFRLRNYEDARRCWLEVSEARPDDAKILLTLFGLSQEFGDEQGMQDALERIRKALGANSSSLKFCEAEQIVWKVKQKKAGPEALDEAIKKLKDARKIRPEWHEIARVSAEIAELQNKPDEAIGNFKAALQLGPPNPNIARRLVALLISRGRIAEVDEAMKYIPNVTDADPLKKVQIEQDLRAGRLDDALADARKVVDAEPENAMNLLWYGQLLSRAGRDEDAQAAFRSAVTKDPKLVQGWLLLVSHLAGTKQLVDAKAVIREARESLPKDQQEAFLAQAYEISGDRKEAEQHVLALLKNQPEDLTMMRNVASFYLRGNELDKARKHLDTMLAAPAASDPKASDAQKSNVIWARRATAQLLAQPGDYAGLQKAIKLLEANRVDGKLPAEDMLLAAGMLAKRPDYSSRDKAKKWLEQVQEVRTLTPEEQFVLAQLYEQTGDWAMARDSVLKVLTNVDGNPGLWGTFAQLLIKHNELNDAERWIEKVEAAEPESGLAIQLRARLLAKQGNGDKAAEMILALLEKAPDENTRLQMIGAVVTMLEEFEQYQQAEALLRQTVAKVPRARLALASFLSRHGELDESLVVLEEARKSSPLASIIQVALEAVRNRAAAADKDHLAKVEKWLATAMEENPDDLTLQLQQAELLDIQGRTDEVIDRYRKMLASKDLEAREQAIIANNLSFVLAMNGKEYTAEALQLINQAIEELGPSSDLLDTRAICYLGQGDNARAIEDLRLAIMDAPTALKYMHLALAEARSGDKAAAAKSLQKARGLKLDVNVLSAREREFHDELTKTLKGT